MRNLPVLQSYPTTNTTYSPSGLAAAEAGPGVYPAAHDEAPSQRHGT